VRSDGYQMLRSRSRDSLSFSDLSLNLPDVEINTLRVAERSPVDGQALGQVELRKRYGVSVLAIRRGETTLSNPGAETRILGNDVVVVLGAPDRIAEAIGLFEGSE